MARKQQRNETDTLANLAKLKRELIADLKAKGIKDPLREALAQDRRNRAAAAHDSERAAARAELDRKMGLVEHRPTVTRTPTSMTFSVVGAPAAPDARRTSRPTATGVVTVTDARARELEALDRAMGITPSRPAVERHGNSLTFSAAGAIAPSAALKRPPFGLGVRRHPAWREEPGESNGT